jgi:hypothetical protein
MKNIMHLLFLSCVKATGLIEKGFYFELTQKERLQLKMHTMMCDACKRYEKQSVFIEKGLAANIHKDLLPEDIDRIKKSIIENLEKS